MQEALRMEARGGEVVGDAADTAEEPSASTASWACPICTFVNTSEIALACEMCGTAKPQSEASVAEDAGGGAAAGGQGTDGSEEEEEEDDEASPPPEFADAPTPFYSTGAGGTVVAAIADVCASAECVALRARASLFSHPECGHRSGGVRGEDMPRGSLGKQQHALAAALFAGDEFVVLPGDDCGEGEALEKGGGKGCGSSCGGLRCLQCSGEADDYCTICFVEGLGAAPAVELTSCGHLFHESCLREQISRRWGGRASIDFGFLKVGDRALLLLSHCAW